MATSLTNINAWLAAGFDRAQFVLSTSGLVKISDLTAPNGRGMARINGVKAANWQFGEDVKVPIEGDDIILAKITFEGDTLPTFDLTASEFNAAFVNTLQGTSTIDVQSTYDVIPIGPSDRDIDDLMIMLTRRAPSQKSGSEGSGYENVLFPLCEVSFRGTGSQFQAAGEYTMSVTVNRVTQTPWGLDLGPSVGGKEKVAGFIFFSEQPASLAAFKEDGLATSFTLPLTIASNAQAIGFDNAGATKAVTVSGNDVTVTAGAGGDRLTVLYEVD